MICWKANDLFAYADAGGHRAIPAHGRLRAGAGFEVFFTGQEKSRMVYLQAGKQTAPDAALRRAGRAHRWPRRRMGSGCREEAQRTPASRMTWQHWR